MWFLWVFGDNVEDHLTPFVFLLLYMTAGIAGNLVQYFFMSNSSIPLLGASGAVAGILGCYYVLFPYSKIRTLVFIFFFVTIIDISAPIMLGYWFLLQLISGAVSLPFMNDQGGIAFWAHVTGFIVGVIFANLFKGRLGLQEVLEGEVIE
jgi:membrane associated rhomboid family serine protease